MNINNVSICEVIAVYLINKQLACSKPYRKLKRILIFFFFVRSYNLGGLLENLPYFNANIAALWKSVWRMFFQSCQMINIFDRIWYQCVGKIQRLSNSFFKITFCSCINMSDNVKASHRNSIYKVIYHNLVLHYETFFYSLEVLTGFLIPAEAWID